MNNVLEKENKERNIQIYRGSKKMFKETKIARAILYLINFVPLALVFSQDLFQSDEATANLIKFSSSAVSLILNILTELLSNIIANHKEEAVLLAQLFETEITGNTLSKMEYDRETTNELYELAIRKGTLKKEKKFKGAYDVPQEIDEKYTFLFINRYIAAETRYLLGKLQIIFGVIITAASVAFIFWLSGMDMAQAVYYIVCFWSVFIPIVRNFTKCTKNKKQCVKMSADIDNFFADGDDSKERLERFNFYVQSLSFEMRNNLVIIPSSLRWFLSYQIKVLDVGVTNRFIEAIYQFEDLVLTKKGIKSSKRKFEWISRDEKNSLISSDERKLINKAKTSVAQAESNTEAALVKKPMRKSAPVVIDAEVKPVTIPKKTTIKSAASVAKQTTVPTKVATKKSTTTVVKQTNESTKTTIKPTTEAVRKTSSKSATTTTIPKTVKTSAVPKGTTPTKTSKTK